MNEQQLSLEDVLTREFMEDCYSNQQKSIDTIATEVGCGRSSIYRRLKKFSIKARGNRKWGDILTKERLGELYLTDRLSTHQIASKIGCNRRIVANHMKKHGIKTRSVAEGTSIREQNGKGFNINPVRNYIDGLVLGDGTILSKSAFSGRYHQGCNYKEWVDTVARFFQEHGILCNVNWSGQQYYLTTLFYPEFRYFKKRWYSDGKKRVPSTLELTPETVGNWYLGDGSLVNRKRNNPASMLCTKGFSREETKLLSDELNIAIGISSHLYRTRNEIYIPAADTPAFLEYIENYKIPCYAYKWGEIGG